MKLKALLVALFVAGLTASIALADGPPGKEHDGKKVQKSASHFVSTTTSTASRFSEDGKGVKFCRPSIQLQFAGTAASDLGSDGSLSVLVSRGRAGGTSLAGKQLTITVPSQARVRGTIAKDAALRVHARACVDVVALTVKLVAMQVRVGSSSGGGDSTSTSTSTESSTSSTSSTTSTTESTSSTTTTG